MSILQCTLMDQMAVGVTPREWRIKTNNTFAEVTTTGYLTSSQSTNHFVNGDYAIVQLSNLTDVFLNITVSVAGVVSLVDNADTQVITYPVTANHIAVFTATSSSSSTLGDDPAIAMNGGDIQAGLNAVAGKFRTYSATTTTGYMELYATANSGAFNVGITNAAHGQTTLLTIPDCGASTANLILSKKTGGQTISVGGLIVAAGNIQAGASGAAGTVISYSSTSARGSLILAAVANTGDTTTTISNAAMGQATVVSIPDPGATTVDLIMSKKTAGQTISVGGLTVSAGNITAGASGAAGTHISYPSAASKGSLILAAVANTGDTNVTISNALHGQASVYSIPDVGAATGQFNVVTGALVSGNLMAASGTAGKLADGGFNIKSAITASYGGGGVSNAFTATGLTTSSIVTAVIVTSTNAVSICKAVPTANTLTITFSGDPGSATTVAWIATSVAVS